MSSCAFELPEVTTEQELVRSDLIRVIYPLEPTIDLNFMFLPLRHVERYEDFTDEEVVALHKAIGQVVAALQPHVTLDGYNLFVNVGKKAGQHIPHVHFHLFGRAETEAVSPFAVMNHPETYPREVLSPEAWHARVVQYRAWMQPLFA